MTTDRRNDVEDLIAALRDDLPSRDDERRIHARLLAGGMALGSLTVAQLGSAAAAGNTAASSTAASSSVVASGAASAAGAAGNLSIAAGTAGAQGLVAVFGKTVLVTALALGAGYPVVSQLLPPVAPTPAPAAVVESKVGGATQSALPERRVAERPSLAHSAEAQQLDVSSSSTRKADRKADREADREVEARAALPEPGMATSVPEGTLEQNKTTRASTLEAETVLIERALRAARMGDDDNARQWLSEHQSRYPNGALAPERQRALGQLRRQ